MRLAARKPPAAPTLPGSTFRETPAPNGSWDWSCDGKLDFKLEMPLKLTAASQCANATFQGSATTTSVADWTHDKILLVDTSAPQAFACSASTTKATCRTGSDVYSKPCSGGTCTPPDGTSQFEVQGCGWNASTSKCETRWDAPGPNGCPAS